MASEEQSLNIITKKVKQFLKLPVEDEKFHEHLAGILYEERPISGNELYELVFDFLDLFKLDKIECLKKCDELYLDLKASKFITNENKFSLSADRLEEALILEEVLSMEDARQPLFAKKPTAGNSNNEMSKWKKKEKGKDKEQEKAMLIFEKHMKEVQDKKKQLPPVQIRREKYGPGRTNDLILENISLVIAGKTLLDGTNLKLAYGRKYGLVGRNGIGKTCLMNALARGQFPKMPTHMQILLVEQEIRDTSKTVIQTVLETDIEREQLLDEQEKLTNVEGNVTKRMNQICKRLDEIQAHKAESKASAILGGLGFTPEMLNRTVGSMSGGWRMRVALARALFVAPDILLLDEPTNHLDLDAVMWLQDYICNCKNTVVIVSHARQFLNVTCNEVMHYYCEKLQYYKGNYDTFEKLRIQNRDRNKREFDSQQMKLEHMQSFIDKFRYNAKRASLVQSRIKAINKMELVEEVIEDPSCVFIFPTPDKLRPPLLRIEDGYFTYDPLKQDKYILRNINFAVDMESRIAIVGANGVGKSTLLKLLVDTLGLSSGNSYRNGRLGLSMFTQHHIDQLKLHLSPLEQFMTDFPGSTQEVYRSHLGSFGMSGALALRPNYLLSGGQKSRVAFALAMWKNPHILVLDEPTNHLDIDAVNALIIALNNYSGGVIIVSHDQHLISTVCEEIWYIKDTRLKKFNGDFEDYRRQLAQGKLL